MNKSLWWVLEGVYNLADTANEKGHNYFNKNDQYYTASYDLSSGAILGCRPTRS